VSNYSTLIRELPKNTKEIYINDINLYEDISQLPLCLERIHIIFDTSYFAWLLDKDIDIMVKKKEAYLKKIKSRMPYGCVYYYCEK